MCGEQMIKFVYYILIGSLTVGVMGSYLNFLSVRDTQLMNYYEQQAISR